jgi:hypothetical protein
MNLTRAYRVLVLAILTGRCPALLLPDGAEHQEIVGEHRLRPIPEEVVHGLEHLGVVALLQPPNSLLIGGASLRRADTGQIGGLVVPQLAELPEGV